MIIVIITDSLRLPLMLIDQRSMLRNVFYPLEDVTTPIQGLIQIILLLEAKRSATFDKVSFVGLRDTSSIYCVLDIDTQGKGAKVAA
jgi:hypothetical protein